MTQRVKKAEKMDFRRILAEKNAIKSTSQLATRVASASFFFRKMRGKWGPCPG